MKREFIIKTIIYSIITIFIPGLFALVGEIFIEISDWYIKTLNSPLGIVKIIVLSIIIGISIQGYRHFNKEIT